MYAGLYKDSYELLTCEYSFSQGADRNGKAQREVRGGTIHVSYPNLPPLEILQWATNSRKYHNGTIVICDINELPFEKIHFENAACMALEIDYEQSGKSYTVTKFTIHAEIIKIGGITLDNNWTI